MPLSRFHLEIIIKQNNNTFFSKSLTVFADDLCEKKLPSHSFFILSFIHHIITIIVKHVADGTVNNGTNMGIITSKKILFLTFIFFLEEKVMKIFPFYSSKKKSQIRKCRFIFSEDVLSNYISYVVAG